MDKLKTLKDIFGHSYFRAGQEQAVDCLLSGRDLLAVMPTGAGKSVCYQLPAVMREGITLVVSPLISLMQDQALSLTQNGVAAAFLNSSLSHSEFMMTLQMAEQGAYKILFVAPERLETEIFRRFAAGSDIAMVIVDEAHCVSQWGQDFRPSYLKIPDFINSLVKRPVVGAFTATATEKVREDIKEKLRLKEPMEIVTGFDRPNLYFEVIKTDTKSKPALLAELLKKFDGKSGIVYCSTRKQTEQTLEICRENGIPAAMYHAGMSDADRSRNQDDFIFDRIRVITATNAFGMGIDKSNVGFVIHYNMPKSPEAYYQEAGRAGRDGTAADCVLLYSPADVNTARYFIDHAEGEGLSETEFREFQRQEKRRLNAMVDYCTTTKCLREFLLAYFGEKCTSCSGCSNCGTELVEKDITDPARRIISCVFRLQQRGFHYGWAMISAVLMGSKGEKVLSTGLDSLSTYGIMSEYHRKDIRDMIDMLVNDGYLGRTDDEYRLIYITEKGHKAVTSGENITVKTRETVKLRKPDKKREIKDYDEGLYQRLKELRAIVAKRNRIPAYMVFTNAALEDMAEKKPSNEYEFLQVNGVGAAKLTMYGREFIDEINDYENFKE